MQAQVPSVKVLHACKSGTHTYASAEMSACARVPAAKVSRHHHRKQTLHLTMRTPSTCTHREGSGHGHVCWLSTRPSCPLCQHEDPPQQQPACSTQYVRILPASFPCFIYAPLIRIHYSFSVRNLACGPLRLLVMERQSSPPKNWGQSGVKRVTSGPESAGGAGLNPFGSGSHVNS